MDCKPLTHIDTSTPVLLFKTGRFPLHHGMLGIIRSLGRLGIEVYAVLEDRFVPAGFSRFLAGEFIWNPDENASEALLDGLQLIGERIGRPAILIPTNDHDAIFMEEHSARLGAWYQYPHPTPGLTRSLADKQELLDICRNAGLPCPRSIVPGSLAEVEDLAGKLEFPVLVKIVRPWLRPRPLGLSSTSIISNAAELTAVFRLAQGPPWFPLLVQEHIPAAGDSDAMYAAYCDHSSRALVSMTGEKLRSYPARAGMTASGRTTDNPGLSRLAESFLARIGYRGVVDLEFRQDLRDGAFKLLDFNPRVGAQFRLYENGAGIDVVRAMYLDLTGQAVPQSPSVVARSLIVENYELRVMWGYGRAHGLGLRAWFRSLRGKWELAWFATDDVLPCAMMWLRLLLGRVWLWTGARCAATRNVERPRYISRWWRNPIRARPR